MPATDMIPATEFCNYHHVELSFIQSLQQSGLISIIIAEEQLYVPENELPRLEKMVRLYYEMDINVEGIETITHLLQRMHELQKQIEMLRNKLNLLGEVE